MNYTCHVGTYGPVAAPLPASWQSSGASQLAAKFLAGSAGSAGGPAIRITVKPPKARPVPRRAAEPMTSAPSTNTLHRLLKELKAGASRARPIHDVGLLFTGRHSKDQREIEAGNLPPMIFGLMFDYGFYPTMPGFRDVFTKVPREGCVVYLDTIDDARDTPASFEDEVAFTAIHEMGHVFNLWHAHARSLMYRSALLDRTGVPPGQWAFLDRQNEFLADCDTSDFVQPGGKPFGERGTGAPEETDADNARPASSALRLRIDAHPRSFRAYEPVELEIGLSLGRGAKPVRVPYELDAGYDDFQIWIEEPDGARRRYRAPLHYCAARNKLRIAPGEPYQRDVSIFGEAGGYTFRKAGEHSIQILWRLRDRSVLRSNRICVEILPSGRKGAELETRAALTDPRAAQLLFYRCASRFGGWADRLEELADARPSSHIGARLHYALGRARLVSARKADTPGARTREKRAGRELLARAEQSPGLGSHERRIAERLCS